MANNEDFSMFDERMYHNTVRGKVNQVLIESVFDVSEAHVSTFIITILQEGLFSVRSFVLAIIYMSRFKEVTKISLHTYSWRLLFITSLLVADKAYDDRPIRLKSLAKLFPIITPRELVALEISFCLKTRFTFLVRAELYDSFVGKLLKESVSEDVREIVECLSLGVEVLVNPPPQLPVTPQTIVKRGREIGTAGTRRSRSRQPDMFGSADTRKQSLSRALSLSSFIDDSIDRSSVSNSSRRRASTGRTTLIPPPPAFQSRSDSNRVMKGFTVNRLCRDPPQHHPGMTYPFEQMLRSNSKGRGESPHRTHPRWNVV
jgi:hypothetical protein